MTSITISDYLLFFEKVFDLPVLVFFIALNFWLPSWHLLDIRLFVQ
jgi:hypothetical protein